MPLASLVPAELFVYGSLMRGGDGHSILVEGRALFLREASTLPRYTLLDLGDYPGLIGEGSTAIFGEVFLIPPSLFPILDRYEDVPDLYRRLPIALSDGSTPASYFYQPSLSSSALILSGGSWRDHLALRAASLS